MISVHDQPISRKKATHRGRQAGDEARAKSGRCAQRGEGYGGGEVERYSTRQQHLPPALQFALVILFHPLARLAFRLYLPGKLFHLALALALNAEKRAATRYARSLIAAHLDAKLLLNAFPFFLEVVHATMIAAPAKRLHEKPQCRSPSLSHATLSIFAQHEQPRY